MSVTKVAKALLERNFFDYMCALAAIGDPNAGDFDAVSKMSMADNPLWVLDLGRTGCRYKLEARGGEYYLFMYHRTHTEMVHQLGNTRQATEALFFLRCATDHALRITNHRASV